MWNSIRFEGSTNMVEWDVRQCQKERIKPSVERVSGFERGKQSVEKAPSTVLYRYIGSTKMKIKLAVERADYFRGRTKLVIKNIEQLRTR